MPKFSRVRLSKDATSKFKTLKVRTGLTPNILSRLALCYSIEHEPSNSLLPSDEEGQELNRSTLLGEHEAYYIAIVKQRCIKDGRDPEKDFISVLRHHINQGAISIYSRLQDLSDLDKLIS